MIRVIVYKKKLNIRIFFKRRLSVLSKFTYQRTWLTSEKRRLAKFAYWFEKLAKTRQKYSLHTRKLQMRNRPKTITLN